MSTISLADVVTALSQRGLPAYVENTGGGCQTIMVGYDHPRDHGAPPFEAVVGPGWLVVDAVVEGDRVPMADTSDLSVGYDMPDTVEEERRAVHFGPRATVEDVADAVARWVKVNGTQPGKPSRCIVDDGPCSNREHDHQSVTGTGAMTCADCGEDLFYDRRTETYWHTAADAEPCPLVTEGRV